MKKQNIFLIPILVGLVLMSCKKDSETDTFSQDQVVLIDQNQTDAEVEDVQNIETRIMESNDSKLGARIATDTITTPFDSLNCATVTIIPKGTNTTGKITVDFGNGCLCKDGRMRKGKIHSVFTDRIKVQGSVILTTFENYSVTKKGSQEYVSVDNTSTKKTTTLLAPTNWTNGDSLTINRESNMKLTLGDGTNFSHVANKEMVLEFNQLENYWDNVYITKQGSNQSGIDRKGRNYTMVVDSDLIRKTQCNLIGVYKPVSGQVTINHDSKTKIVNYGDGNCDSQVDVTINGRKVRTRW